MTHQAIADQLGVAREMVSRVMRGFSERGWITQSREAIEVTDVVALDEVSQG
jgi:CRP/FNR family transcriptional regulator